MQLKKSPLTMNEETSSPRQMNKWFWLAALIIVLDQGSKAAAETWLQLYQPVAVMPMFNFTLMYNEGAAFSFLADAGGWQRWFFLITTTIITVVLMRWLRELNPAEKWKASGYALIIGGALGNLIDRIATGAVVDFLDFYIGNNHWPAFNIADSAITVGVTILIIATLFDKDQSSAS